MVLHDVYMVSHNGHRATEAEITAAAAVLGTAFPDGYRDYVMTFGAGQFNDRMRVLTPGEIVDRTEQFRDIQRGLAAEAEADGFSRWDLFEAGLDLFPPERLLSAILLIDAGDGEEIVFHPSSPDDLFHLPHDDTRIERAGRTLDDAITWFLEGPEQRARTRVLTAAGDLVERPVRYFESDRDRLRVEFALQESVSFAEIRAYLVTCTRHTAAETLFVSEPYANGDASEGEVLHVFLKEYGGAVWCNDSSPDQGGMTLQIAYDRDLRTDSLDHLIAFCRQRARWYYDETGQTVTL